MYTVSCETRVLEIYCFQTQIPSSSFQKEYFLLQGPLLTSQMQIIHPKADVWCWFRHYSLAVSLGDCSPCSFEIHMTSTARSVLASNMAQQEQISKVIELGPEIQHQHQICLRNFILDYVFPGPVVFQWLKCTRCAPMYHSCTSLVPPGGNIIYTLRLFYNTNQSTASEFCWRIHSESTLQISIQTLMLKRPTSGKQLHQDGNI